MHTCILKVKSNLTNCNGVLVVSSIVIVDKVEIGYIIVVVIVVIVIISLIAIERRIKKFIQCNDWPIGVALHSFGPSLMYSYYESPMKVRSL